MSGISADADGGQAPLPSASAAKATANIRKKCEDRSRALIGNDAAAIIKIGHAVIGHAEAARGYRLADRLRLVGAVNAIQRRAQIHGAGAKRIVDAARHVARQIGPTRQHLRGRGPARPFPLRRDAVDAAPAKAVAADTDAVAKRLALRQDEIKPPLGGVYVNGAGPILAYKAHDLAPGRAGARSEERRVGKEC